MDHGYIGGAEKEQVMRLAVGDTAHIIGNHKDWNIVAVSAEGGVQCSRCCLDNDSYACDRIRSCTSVYFEEVADRLVIEQPRRPHADLIIEWANGESIQFYSICNKEWLDCMAPPKWDKDTEYRIKPKEPVIKEYLGNIRISMLDGEPKMSFDEMDFKNIKIVADECGNVLSVEMI